MSEWDDLPESRDRAALEVLFAELGAKGFAELVRSAVQSPNEPCEQRIDLALSLESEWDLFTERMMAARPGQLVNAKPLETEPNFNMIAAALLRQWASSEVEPLQGLGAAVRRWFKTKGLRR